MRESLRGIATSDAMAVMERSTAAGDWAYSGRLTSAHDEDLSGQTHAAISGIRTKGLSPRALARPSAPLELWQV